VTPETVGEEFDAIVVATGARWEPPSLGDGAPVLTLAQIRSAPAERLADVGRSVAVLGDTKAAMSLAHLLARGDRDVTLIGEEAVFGAEIAMPLRWRLAAELREAGVHLLAGTVVERFADGALYARGHQPRVLPVDVVVDVRGAQPDSALADALRTAGHQVHTVGDCRVVEHLEGSTAHALVVARALEDDPGDGR
jgi:pyruvate/2-oxoglutarate dehydrogenase complex dihydrolipoamide dehydrogenase (E3) component